MKLKIQEFMLNNNKDPIDSIHNRFMALTRVDNITPLILLIIKDMFQ